MLSKAMLGLPLIVLKPAKFAFFYSMANVFLLAGVMLLIGAARTFSYLMKPNNLVASVGYIFSLFFTLFAAIQLKMYLLIVAALICQLFCLFWFVAGHIPLLKQLIVRGFSFSFSMLTR
eukprot:c9973_g1_i1.p1 GENE.c9973_g1_i1~~c9973_g1_i1.p1  ORF type:complete len:119 (+),score=20.42 c9973_g1_i1:387-743(+)